jgi:uncharacterized protein involved in type VI secretion and phage assembly
MPAERLDRRLYGVCVGLIEENEDPDSEGRVRVRFPWLDDATVSEWCRVCQLYAGNQYGSFFVPEVGDEVLIAFGHGDMAEPIVLGGLYNGQDKPPSARTAQQDQKLIRTKGEHQILLDDSAQSKMVEVTTAGGHVLTLDDQNKKITLASKSGHTVELDDQGKKVTVKSMAGHQIVMDDSAMSLKITGVIGQTIEMDGSGGMKLSATTTLTLSAPMIKIGS